MQKAILVVNGDVTKRVLLTSSLKAEFPDREILYASDGEEAKRTLAERADDIGTVVLDVPVDNDAGPFVPTELMRDMRDNRPELVFVAVGDSEIGLSAIEDAGCTVTIPTWEMEWGKKLFDALRALEPRSIDKLEAAEELASWSDKDLLDAFKEGVIATTMGQRPDSTIGLRLLLPKMCKCRQWIGAEILKRMGKA